MKHRWQPGDRVRVVNLRTPDCDTDPLVGRSGTVLTADSRPMVEVNISTGTLPDQRWFYDDELDKEATA